MYHITAILPIEIEDSRPEASSSLLGNRHFCLSFISKPSFFVYIREYCCPTKIRNAAADLPDSPQKTTGGR